MNHLSGLFYMTVRPIDWHFDRLSNACQCLHSTQMAKKRQNGRRELGDACWKYGRMKKRYLCEAPEWMWRESQIFAVIRGEQEQLCSLCVHTWNATLRPKAYVRFITNHLQKQMSCANTHPPAHLHEHIMKWVGRTPGWAVYCRRRVPVHEKWDSVKEQKCVYVCAVITEPGRS